MEHVFSTPAPPTLVVEVGSGRTTLTATQTETTTIRLSGRDAEETTVTQDGDTISVIGPRTRRGFSLGTREVNVEVVLPAHSALHTKFGSAALTATGPLGDCTVRSGSGDITLDEAATLDATSGSGDIRTGDIARDGNVRTGSGDVALGSVGGQLNAVTGSGNVRVHTSSHGARLRSGSGDIAISRAAAGVSANTASGDVTVEEAESGSVELRTASGDIAVGVADGTPAWTDINTLTGQVRSTLQRLGEPAQGQPYVELRLRTVSGDIAVGHRPPAPPAPPAPPQPAAAPGPTHHHAYTDES